METTVAEIAAGVYRMSTLVEAANFQFNQFLVDGADGALLFHTGPRQLFPLVRAAAERVVPLERLRWITFGHVEADECGAMDLWRQAAPNAVVAHTAVGVMVSVNDLLGPLGPATPLEDGQVIDLGSHRLRHLDTPHVPHGWDAGLLFEEVTGTLFAGDLFAAFGPSPALASSDLIGPALATEDVMHSTALTPATAPAIAALAQLQPQTMGLMHGPSFDGDCAAALHELAAAYEERLAAAAGLPRPREITPEEFIESGGR